MTAGQLLAASLTSNFQLLKMTLSDFADHEMVVCPVPAANHALWQLGHLAVAESQFLALIGGTPPSLPVGWDEAFASKNAKDDATTLPTKAEVLQYLEQLRSTLIEQVRAMSPEDLDQPVTGAIAAMAPKRGNLALLIVEHTTMHIGQFQVIRRKLGKPVLF